MKKRRVLAAALVVCMTAAMVFGCGNSSKDSGSTASSGGKDYKYRIGFANASISNSWRVKMRQMLVDECKKENIELIETDAHDDANTQNSNIEAMLQKDLDAILITPCVEDAANPGIEAAFESGIPVIIFDRTCTTDEYTHFVGYSDKENGAECAQMLVDALTEKNGSAKGNIIALDSIAGSSTDNFQKAGQDSVFSKYPDVKIIDRQYTDFEAGKGKSFMEDCLSKYGPGEIDGVISQDGGVTLAAMDAIKEAGRDKDGILIVNADGINGVAKMVKDGTAVGFTQFPCAASVDALHTAIDTLEGKDPKDKDITMDSIVVTKDNVDDYLIPDGDDYDWTY
ncbi:substrate-binding domain-containing protein [Hespellia stercorisuis]|uniref:Substrate-binding protein domain-containing protein n=1 Tax=Hespellia stercorisuis DSM 15480 TaxID=1121950 RepID=A0A1M6RCK4_9FIRM|nr:substrate-binding domain-containing protein [Hespellia stercorisuis]SHK30194.1 substrate-binding protein domain-containing protein [Hespellia stercorisuis DSM 15480]